MPEETDHISEKELADAYNLGWDCYPMKKPGGDPYKNPILKQAWQQGYDDHWKEPSPVSFDL